MKRLSAVAGRLGPTTLRGSGATTVLTGFGVQAILVVSGVLVARLLPVEQRGQLALLGLLPLILSQVAGLGLPLATTYQLARKPASARAVAALLVRLVPARTLSALLVHVAVLSAVFYADGGSAWTAALLTLPAVPALMCHQVGLAVLQGRKRFTVFNLCRLLPIGSYAAVLVVAALGGLGTLPACAAAWTGAWLLGGAVSLTIALRELRTAAGNASIEQRSFVRFGRRGILGSVSPVEGFQLDQVIVAALLTQRDLGLYVVAVALTNLPRFVSQSVGIIAYPRIAEQENRVAGMRDLWRFVGLNLALNGMIVIILMTTAGALIPFFFGADYAGAVPVAQILFVAALFQATRRVLADAARGLGHPELGTVAEVASWFVLVPAVLLIGDSLEGIAVAMGATSAASLAVLILGVVLRGGRPPTHPPEAMPGGVPADLSAAPAAEAVIR